MKDISIIFCCFLFSFSCIAQENIENLSNGKLKKMAQQAERNGDLETATIYLSSYLERKPDDASLRYQLAENYRKMGLYKKALDNYETVRESEKAKRFSKVSFYYAEMLVANEKCEEAIPIYDQFRKEYRGEKNDRKYSRLSKFAIEGCERKLQDTSNADKFAIVPMPEGVNGNHIEGSPIFLDDNQLLYKSLKSEGKQVYELEEDILAKRKFYTSNRVQNEWQEGEEWEVLKDFNSLEIANGAFNQDRSRFYFSACEENMLGKVSCDIFKIEKENGKWTSPSRLPETVNSKFTETQVAVGIDEKGRETIYFVSDRKEGKGGLDIWYSTFYKNSYREARNCGSKVNSIGDEMTPYIHPLNNQLYFSSDGHPGFGQLDLFKTSGQRSRWKEPENLGSWINSPADELYFSVHPDGSEGVFASNRKQKKGEAFCCDDLFYFKELNKIDVSAKGKVLSEENPLSEAEIKVYQLDEEGEKVFLQSVKSDKNGEYKVVLEPNQEYFIQASKEGFLVDEKTVKTSNSLTSMEYNVDLDLLKKGDRSFELKNIYYDYDAASFDKASELAIDTTILEILLLNPEVIIEIGSHTDDKGSAAYNQSLSQRRAESVVKYLRKNGISKNRLKAKGYGESQPALPNTNSDGTDNPENRAKNRRTEFKVIGELDLEEEGD